MRVAAGQVHRDKECHSVSWPQAVLGKGAEKRGLERAVCCNRAEIDVHAVLMIWINFDGHLIC